MIDREELTNVAFEMLKLLFFIVTYFLIIDAFNTVQSNTVLIYDLEKLKEIPAKELFEELISALENIKDVGLSSFYNTLFIFSASTWIDYLSAMKDAIRSDNKYDGKYFVHPYVNLIGTVFGFFTTTISLLCVFFKYSPKFIIWGAFVYGVLLFFLSLKAFVVTDMLLHIIDSMK